MATYTKAKIFNMALKNLGVSVGVQGANQTDRNTVVLNEFYEAAKDKTLKDYDWSFASAFRELTPTGKTSLNPKYSYEYDYPNDCVFVREIVTTSETPISFQRATNLTGQQVILTNESPATIRYTRSMENQETFYPPEFAMAFSWFLAFLAASSITGARVQKSDCLQIYKQMIKEGRVTDANEGYETNAEEITDWYEARG